MGETQQIDVTSSTQRISDFIRGLGRIKRPIEIVLRGKVVGRMVAPEELTAEEKREVLRKGWQFVERARERNRGVPERKIGRAVDAAVKRVRSRA